MTTYSAEFAWLDHGVAREVRITVHSGRILAVETDADIQDGDVRLSGLVMPGFANTHSHAFHRALRGRTHDASTFWTWRERMYAIAARLDPDSYFALARATFAEMALAGVTSVGEFHYLHHAQGGRRYADPNAMGNALIEAARQAGIRITLLDACYLAGGVAGEPLDGAQLRFGDGTAAAWADRVAALRGDGNTIIGAAIHSVRAVPRDELPIVVSVAARRPLHVHVSEQPAENEQCLRAYGRTPAGVLDDAGALGPLTTAVHATHVSPADITLLGHSHTSIGVCPTTERDLADGIGPARDLLDAGAPLTLGSDQQMTGHHSLGWADAGYLAAGARADLVSVRLGTVRTAGVEPGQAMLAASAADVDTVIVDGRVVVRDGEHVLGDVGGLLRSAIVGLPAE